MGGIERDTAQMNGLDMRFPVASASVTSARHSAGEFAESVGAVRHDVELAVSEAVTNSVVHAYPDGREGTITLQAEREDGGLVLTVRDDGTGLRPDPDSKGIGLGLPLIARLSKDYRIEEAPGGGTAISMRFGIGMAGVPSEGEGAVSERQSRSEGIVTVEVKGEVDLQVAPRLEKDLNGVALDKPVLVDMSAVTFLDSSGMRALLLAAERFAVAGARWAIVLSDASRVRAGLALAGIDHRLPLRSNRKEALLFLEGPG